MQTCRHGKTSWNQKLNTLYQDIRESLLRHFNCPPSGVKLQDKAYSNFSHCQHIPYKDKPNRWINPRAYVAIPFTAKLNCCPKTFLEHFNELHCRTEWYFLNYHQYGHCSLFCITPTNSVQWLWILADTPNLLLTLLNNSGRATEKRSLCLLTIALLCKCLFSDSGGNIKVNNFLHFLLLSSPIPKMSALSRWTGRTWELKMHPNQNQCTKCLRIYFSPKID